ncbi:MAG: hypothetical protein LC722_05060 [Actinobacteria bacterium]|nr:hypothetical protein [Actinomycetota bacterium]
MIRINRERLPLSLSLLLLGLGAGATGLQSEQGLYLTVAGFTVIGIGTLVLFSQGNANQVRYQRFDLGETPVPRLPPGVEARVAWSGDGSPPQEVRNALKRMGINLEAAAAAPAEGGTRVFTAHLEAGKIKTTEDDLRTRGVPGTALVERAKNRRWSWAIGPRSRSSSPCGRRPTIRTRSRTSPWRPTTSW